MRKLMLMGALAAMTVAAAAQTPTYKRDVPDSLAKLAKITEDSARAIAQKAVPKGVLKALEIEREKGKLIYSMEFTIPGRAGIQEVNVDAMTGKLISVEHESNGDVVFASPNYHVVRKLTVGGDGGWDYLSVDTVNHKLYISRGTHVMIIDTDNEKVVGDIPNTMGVHGIAIANDLNRGYTSNGRDSSVTIFDLKTYAVIANVKVGSRNPDAILYEPTTKRIFTFNGGSSNATALDAVTGAVIGTVALTGKPEFAQHDGKGTVFVNIENKEGAIIAFDAKTLAPQAPWMMAGCEEPSGLAIDRGHGVLFSTCGNKVMAITDAKSGKQVATVPIGSGVDAGAFDPGTQFAFASNGEGTLTVVKSTGPGAYAVAATVPTQARARTMALDERTHRIYTVTADFGTAPAPTADNPRPRPPMIAGSFVVLVLEP